ncbi:MAG: hypothetical protein R2799_07750 [Crocinitomicaceae bacterium]
MKGFKTILILLSINVFNQIQAQEFGFASLLFSSEGVALKSRELPKYENLVINVLGIQGYRPIEGMASIGMEVRVSDAKDQQIMYSPDMFDGQNIPIDNIPALDFNFSLTENFEVGQTYFISVRLWDRLANLEMTKEATIKVLEPIKNQNAEISEKLFQTETVKLYLNKGRYYKGKLIREGDELNIDLFLKPIELQQKVALNYSVYLLEEGSDKKIPVESDALAVTDPNQLRTLNYSIKFEGDKIQPGKKYVLVVYFSIDELEATLKLEYHFDYLEPSFKSNTEIVEIEEFHTFLNKEEIGNKLQVFPGDRIDFDIRNLNTQLVNEYNTNRIGGILILEDGKGKEISRSDDLFQDVAQVGTDKTSEITLHWNAAWDLEENEKYKLKAIIWDKYSRKRFEKSYDFKSAKILERPYGKDLNSAVKFDFDASKVEPISVFVLVNGFKYSGNELKPGDVVFLKVAARKIEGIDASGFKNVIQVIDNEGNILSENIERTPQFTEGEAYATITIPYSNEEIGKTFKLISKLVDLHDLVIGAEYTFKVVR